MQHGVNLLAAEVKKVPSLLERKVKKVPSLLERSKTWNDDIPDDGEPCLIFVSCHGAHFNLCVQID